MKEASSLLKKSSKKLLNVKGLFRIIISEINRLSRKGSLLFVNKKKQKNFVNYDFHVPACRRWIPVHSNKSFLLLFFKKDASFLFCNLLISLVMIRSSR